MADPNLPEEHIAPQGHALHARHLIARELRFESWTELTHYLGDNLAPTSLRRPNEVHRHPQHCRPVALGRGEKRSETEAGYWIPCDKPRLGIEVDETAASKHPFEQEIIHGTTSRAHDGAILYW